ncbi:hypothetical protein FO519_004283 [Halicephalobus sp. NKZ332]|nr:hypothetical protein FO519_004283 [Halicephalobus sp. NKZ332]
MDDNAAVPRYLPERPVKSQTTFSIEDQQEEESVNEGPEMVVESSYTSLSSIKLSNRRITEVDEDEEKSDDCQLKLKEKSGLLLRLFESPLFDITIAMQYLFNSKETGILLYLGNRLFKFPNETVDFYIPQLMTIYINMPDVAQVLHPYILKRCQESVLFSLECYWLLEAYGVEQVRKQSNKAQGYALYHQIFNEFLRDVSSRSNSRNGFHTRSRSDAPNITVASTNSLASISQKQENGIHRSDSAVSVRSVPSAPGDLSTGKAFDDGCKCEFQDEDEFECSCGASHKTRAEIEFVRALMNIGNRLKDIPLKADKSHRLVYELFMLNLNLPARVYLPLFANTVEHFVVRIPHTSGCVLNSKDKAPYCIYVEVIEVEDLYKSKLPQKLPEGDSEFHKRIRTPSMNSSTSNLVIPGLKARPGSNSALDSLNLVPSGNIVFESPQQPECLSLNDAVLDDDKLTQFDKLFIDDKAESASQVSAESEDVAQVPQEQAPPKKSKGILNPAEIRQRLSELKKKKRKKMEHCPEDPSASAMSEPWEEKLIRIRESSPYGTLQGWRLLPVIIKTGDDLRQELLAYQLLTTLQILMLQGLIAARKHHERLINIVEIMINGSQLPCFRGGQNVIKQLRDRFHINCTEQQMQELIVGMVEMSRDSLTTRLYDNFQYYTNGIF